MFERLFERTSESFRVFDFERKRCEVNNFVGEPTVPSQNQDRFVALLQRALANAKDEKQLQDAVFKACKSHDSVAILEESKRKRPENPAEEK